MLYELKSYQRKAVDELKKYLKLGLASTSRKQFVLKAPTGSGKTFMASSLLEEINAENHDDNFCVIWACPGKGDLHKQSFNAVNKYLGGNPKCSLLEDAFLGAKKQINNKEIVFVNWEKLIQKDKESGKWANNLMKDQEGINFIDVIEKTKKNRTKIILVVDESHIGASQKTRVQEFKDTIIIPEITLEMSATPLTDHIDVEINPQDVIDEGMIKKDVIVNEGILKSDVSLANIDSEILILQKGFEKRNQIIAKYKELGVMVNPLVLVQIPNKDEGEAKKLIVTDFLRDRGVTEENGKLKFWCDDKGNFDKQSIKNNNDITEFLVFKTAVATGWDCPRAHILIKFRDGNSETFEIQTIGRILRTAEAKSYDDNLLDNAYIFTNLATFERKSDTYNPNRIKTEFSKMLDGYDRNRVWEETRLTSFYRSRQGDYNSADSRFTAYFLKAFMDYFGLVESDKNSFMEQAIAKFESKHLNLTVRASDRIIDETKIKSAEIDNDGSTSNGSVIVRMSDNDVQSTYNAIIRENLNGLAYIRSKSPINSAIINAFSIFYNVFPRSTKVKNIMEIVVNNKDIFAEILSNSTQEFRKLLIVEAGKKGDYYDFKIDDSRPYSIETHEELDSSIKSLYQPLYVLRGSNGNVNQLEKDFLSYLDSQQSVEWYWENGPELMRINFGISYNGGMNTFQPDFIVKFVDGTVGIFDTKPIDLRVEDTTIKNRALFDYLKSTNENRNDAPKVIGGIVVQKGSQFYYYGERDYVDYNDSSSKWINFNSIIRNIEDYLEDMNK